MTYDFYTVETYKFAASHLNKDISEHLKESELCILDLVLKTGVARKVTHFLRDVNDPDSLRLSSTLDTLADRVESLIRERKQGMDINVQNAQRLVNHDEGQKGIPFANAAIHMYASIRLANFIDERIVDGKAEEFYDFCKTLKERIYSFLKIFIEDYEIRLGKYLSPQRQAMQNGKTPEGQASNICYICRRIYFLNPKLSEFLDDLNKALLRMEQYIAQNQLASQR